MPSLIARLVVYVSSLLPLLASVPVAVAEEPAELHRAYYLENAKHDYAAARALYERLAADRDLSDAARVEAARRAARCRDQLAGENFASLMPADVLGYVELRRPLGLVRALADALGLAGADMQTVLADRPDADAALPFNLPKRINISPALLESLASFGGAAVAITDVRENGQPAGVLVLHHGDVLLAKGIIETAFQFSPTARKIADLPTFGFQDQAVGVLTDSLLIVGSSRGLVEGAVNRLMGSGEGSLAGREDLAEVHARRTGATLFAYADAPRILARAKERMGGAPHSMREFAEINAIADLDNLKWAAFSFGIADGVVSADLTVRMNDGHRNLIYNLLRLPSMSRKSLEFVPPDAVGLLGIGLNPPIGRVERPAAGSPAISGLDLGREIFGNIQELTAFAVPGRGVTRKWREGNSRHSQTLPDVGVVIASSDPDKSAALWNQLLALPAMFGGKPIGEPTQTEIAGVQARAYELPEVGTVYLAQVQECLLVGLTKQAVRSAIQAQQRKKSIVSDEVLGAALKRVPAEASVVFIAAPGRGAALAANMADMPTRMPLNMAADAMKQTVLWAGLGQSPNEMSLRVGLCGLPNVNAVVQRVAPLIPTGAFTTTRERPTVQERRRERILPRSPQGRDAIGKADEKEAEEDE